jgi:membrane fusion protein (multidrug efflux system)
VATFLATESSVDQATRTLKVRAIVNKNHEELVPGIFARVNLQLGKDQNALLVPTQAVIPQARGKQIILYKNKIASYNDVETGIRDSAYVQVLSGVKAGDTIITSGLMAVRPGTKVNVVNVKHYQ